nr:glycosyltransferase family 4 protein [Clostridium beijerinckii]
MPTQEDEERFNIVYSDWFETRAEYYECLKKQSIYISPRLYEGIGFSFLEAMAMGKVIVSVDNATMNEYIVHGKNGILFSIDDVKPIKFEDIKQLQLNSYNTIVQGRKKWEESIPSMLDYIEDFNIIDNINVIQQTEETQKFSGVNASRTENVSKLSKTLQKLMRIKRLIKKIIKCLMPYGLVRIYQKYIKK